MTIRRSLAEIADQAVIDESGIMTVDDRKIAVVYYRTGYSPEDYQSEKEWQAR